MTSLIPDTTPSCRWTWSTGRCEPACECELRYEPFDYHLGRACRKRREEDEPAASDCGERPGSRYVKGVDGVLKGVGVAREKTMVVVDLVSKKIEEARIKEGIKERVCEAAGRTVTLPEWMPVEQFKVPEFEVFCAEEEEEEEEEEVVVAVTAEPEVAAADVAEAGVPAEQPVDEVSLETELVADL